MKVKSIFYAMILIIIASCTQQQSKLPQGAWQLVYAKWTMSDSLTFEFPVSTTGSDIKMWTENHFLTVGRFQMDTIFMDNGVGGTYTLDGNKYEETILYTPGQNGTGQKVKMLLELRNDTLIQTWPVDENGQIDKNNYSVEKYIRLD
jgi:hypothetical protein